MTGKERLFAGVLGALMPICAIVLTLDLGAIFSDASALEKGHLIGIVIQFIIFLFVGGTVAYMHSDETKAYKLFQIGMATPALLASFTTSNGLNNALNADVEEAKSEESASPDSSSGEEAFNFSIISSAFAYDEKSNIESPETFQVAMGGDSFVQQVIQGVTGKAYGDAKKPKPVPPKNNTNNNKPLKPSTPRTSTLPPSVAPAPVVSAGDSSSAGVIRIPEEASLEIDDEISVSPPDVEDNRRSQVSYEELQRKLREIESLRKQIETQMRGLRTANPTQ